MSFCCLNRWSICGFWNFFFCSYNVLHFLWPVFFIGKSWRNFSVKKWKSQTKLQKVGLISETVYPEIVTLHSILTQSSSCHMSYTTYTVQTALISLLIGKQDKAKALFILVHVCLLLSIMYTPLIDLGLDC